MRPVLWALVIGSDYHGDMPLHLPVGACACLQYACSHAHIWLCLPWRVLSDQLELALHDSSIHTSLTTKQSKQLEDNVSSGVGVGV